MKSACYYIGEQEEDPQEREVDRKDRRKAVFSSGSSKSFGSGSKRFRHAGFKILKAKRCGENTLGSTAFLTKWDPIGRSAMKRRKPGREKSIRRQTQSFHSSSEAETFPKKGIKAKAKNPRYCKRRSRGRSEKQETQTEAKKREHSGTEILRNSNRTARNLLKESCGEPQGKFITESGWAQWVAKHSSILSAAHCASDNIQQEKCLQRHAEVLSLPVVWKRCESGSWQMSKRRRRKTESAFKSGGYWKWAASFWT